jgi:hypothetical protein
MLPVLSDAAQPEVTKLAKAVRDAESQILKA